MIGYPIGLETTKIQAASLRWACRLFCHWSGVNSATYWLEEANGAAYWHLETGLEPAAATGRRAFVDPLRPK
jgi:hypothetical protein